MNGVSELPFLDLGDESRVAGEGKDFGFDDITIKLSATELPSFITFRLGISIETSIYVSFTNVSCYFNIQVFYNSKISSNGLISFGFPFVSFEPGFTPDRIVAPYWVDIDLRDRGLILYAVLIQGQNPRLNNSLAIFNIVNGYITDTVLKGASVFRARWILAARWINVCPFGNSTCTLVRSKILKFTNRITQLCTCMRK